MSWEFKVREYIRENKTTQTEFAESFGESQAWLSNKLNGIRSTTLDDLEKMAKAMKTTAAELVAPADEEYQVNENPAVYTITPSADEYEMLVNYRNIESKEVRDNLRDHIKVLAAEHGH